MAAGGSNVFVCRPAAVFLFAVGTGDAARCRSGIEVCRARGEKRAFCPRRGAGADVCRLLFGVFAPVFSGDDDVVCGDAGDDERVQVAGSAQPPRCVCAVFVADAADVGVFDVFAVNSDVSLSALYAGDQPARAAALRAVGAGAGAVRPLARCGADVCHCPAVRRRDVFPLPARAAAVGHAAARRRKDGIARRNAHGRFVVAGAVKRDRLPRPLPRRPPSGFEPALLARAGAVVFRRYSVASASGRGV